MFQAAFPSGLTQHGLSMAARSILRPLASRPVPVAFLYARPAPTPYASPLLPERGKTGAFFQKLRPGKGSVSLRHSPARRVAPERATLGLSEPLLRVIPLPSRAWSLPVLTWVVDRREFPRIARSYSWVSCEPTLSEPSYMHGPRHVERSWASIRRGPFAEPPACKKGNPSVGLLAPTPPHQKAAAAAAARLLEKATWSRPSLNQVTYRVLYLGSTTLLGSRRGEPLAVRYTH